MNLVIYAVPFFILAMAVELLYGWRRKHNTYRFADTLNSLQLGTLSRLRGVLQIGIGSTAYSALTGEAVLIDMDQANVWVWVTGFIAYDLCYYFSHRYGHEWRLLWASHVAHHQSEEFNLSTALRQTSTGFLNSVFYIPLYLIGFPVYVIVTVGSLNLIYQFWVHTEHVRRIGPLEWLLVTPSNHRVHHAKNPEYLDRNYGGVFIVWDRLFRTFKDEDPDQPCVYGTTVPLASWNPLWANFHIWYEGFSDMLRTRHFPDRFLLWFKGPGWRPRDLRDQPKGDWRAPKFSPAVSTFARAYTFAQFWVILVATFAVLYGGLPQTPTLLAAALLVYSFYVQGVWLEGRPWGTALEWLRLAATGIFLWQGALTTPALWPPVLAEGVSVYLLACAATLLWATLRGRVSLPTAPGLAPAHQPAGGGSQG